MYNVHENYNPKFMCPINETFQVIRGSIATANSKEVCDMVTAR